MEIRWLEPHGAGSAEVNRSLCPVFNRTARPWRSRPVRILGPHRSCNSATGRPASSEACRTQPARAAWSVAAMGEVQTGHIHPRPDQFFDSVVAMGGGS